MLKIRCVCPGWILNKYFHEKENRKWVFSETIELQGSEKILTLKKLADIPIVRHVKIKKDANPFDSCWDDYFEKRRLVRLRVRYTH